MIDLSMTLADPIRFPILYGTTPPRADASAGRVEGAAARLTERLADLPVDGIVVYDVQDESDRTREPRPFPFLPTLDSRLYSRLLRDSTGRPVVTYKAIASVSADSWDSWLEESARDYGVNVLSLVGSASSRAVPGGLSLSEALRSAGESRYGFTLGGVVIPERHRPERSEARRLIHKMEQGCRYFISQAVYDPQATLKLLRDYARECAAQDVAPCRVVLTFTPCGRAETLRFMRWLGISIPEETEQDILASPTPLEKSLDICVANMRTILDARATFDVPLGVNVESVSIRKEEIEGAIRLCRRLADVVNE